MRDEIRSRRAALTAAALLAVLTYVTLGITPDRIVFNMDVAEQLNRNVDILSGGPYPLVGTDVGPGDPRRDGGGLFVGPAAFYATVPVVAAGGGVLEMEHFVGLLAALATALWVWMAWHAFSPTTGVLAGLFHALHPLIPEWGLHPFHVGMLPFLSALGIALSWWALESEEPGRTWRRALVAGIAVGVATHGHAVALGLVVALPAARLALRRTALRPLLAYAFGLLISYGSWFGYELRHDFEQLRTLLGVITAVADPGRTGTAGSGFLDMAGELTRPVGIYRWGACVGLAGLWLRHRRRPFHEGSPATHLLLLCGATGIAWLTFVVGFCLESNVFAASGAWSRFFVPMLGPLALLAALGWSLPVDLLPAGRRRLGLAAGAVTLALAGVVGWGIEQQRYRPYPERGLALRLAEAERYVDWLAPRIGGLPIGELGHVGPRDGPVPADANIVLSARALLRLRALGGPAIDTASDDVLTLVFVRDCAGRDTDHGRFEDFLDVKGFADCGAAERWFADYAALCEEGGRVLSLSNSVPRPFACTGVTER